MSNREARCPQGWSVGHTASGLAVARHISSKVKARQWMGVAEALPVNGDRPVKELKRDESAVRICGRLQETVFIPGWQSRTSPPPASDAGSGSGARSTGGVRPTTGFHPSGWPSTPSGTTIASCGPGLRTRPPGPGTPTRC